MGDPRDARGVRHGHLGLLSLLVAAFACGKRGFKQAAYVARDVGQRTREKLGLPAQVDGTTLWRLLAAHSTEGFRETLAAQVRRLLAHPKVAHVAFSLKVLSVDGKWLWAGHEAVEGLEAVTGDAEGGQRWRLGALRAVLTSVVAAPCVDLEFLSAKEGEAPAFRQLLPRVVENLGDTFDVVTADAGLTCAENAELLLAHDKHFLLGLKGNQPTLLAHAEVAIADKRCPPRARTEDRARGEKVVRELWTHALKPGEVDFPGARMLLLVLQTRVKDDGTRTEEFRYFVTSLNTTQLDFRQLLQLVRMHWGIENRHNWTLDVVLKEDTRQPCRHSRTALEVVAWLRALAYNVLAAWRGLLPREGRHPVPWERACELLRDVLVHGRSTRKVPLLAPA